MSALADIPAVIVAVNVKPQRLAGDESLMQTVPLRCKGFSPEWDCVLYTKSGAADACNRSGGPPPIILQQVSVNPAQVKDEPSERDVMVWGTNQKGRCLRSAVVVPRFSGFVGRMGDTDIELDSAVVRDFFRSWRRDAGFCLFLLCC